MNSSQIVGVVGLSLYGALGLFMIFSFLYSTITKKKEVSSLSTNVRRIFRGFISIFLLCKLNAMMLTISSTGLANSAYILSL